uniref:UPF0057-domain-containing protein n=1 Tax=Ascaris lumbricoides TaxID=6252 RepID=A0A0M3IL11_ASCLU
MLISSFAYCRILQIDNRISCEDLQSQCRSLAPIVQNSAAQLFYHRSECLLRKPVGVFVEKGCSVHLAINILLTILGYIPGLIHAIIIICYY